MVDTKLANSIKELRIAEQTRLSPNDALGDPFRRQRVRQAPEPESEVLSLANLDHA